MLSIPGKEGSVVEGDGAPLFAMGKGRPGIWQKEVTAAGEVVATLVPAEGATSDLLRASDGPVVEDPRVELARAENSPPVLSGGEAQPEPVTVAGDGNRRLDVEGIALGERPRLQKQ